jgi:hypothetical protein
VSDTPEQRKNESTGEAMEEGLSEDPGGARVNRIDKPRKVLRFMGGRFLIHSLMAGCTYYLVRSVNTSTYPKKYKL